MKRTPPLRRAPLRAKDQLRRSTPLRRTPAMAASDAQRVAVAGRACIVCGADRRIDPAHLIPRSLGVAAIGCASFQHAAIATGRTIAASWTCCPTWSPLGGRSWRTP